MIFIATIFVLSFTVPFTSGTVEQDKSCAGKVHDDLQAYVARFGSTLHPSAGGIFKQIFTKINTNCSNMPAYLDCMKNRSDKEYKLTVEMNYVYVKATSLHDKCQGYSNCEQAVIRELKANPMSDEIKQKMAPILAECSGWNCLIDKIVANNEAYHAKPLIHKMGSGLKNCPVTA